MRGTGFFYQLQAHDGSSVPVLISNKHVVRGASSISFHVSLADSTGRPAAGNHRTFVIDSLPESLVEHPDNAVDLCALLVTAMTATALSEGWQLCYRAITDSLTISDADLQLVASVEDVIVIGYPTGLWDPESNRPIVRRGITATPLHADFLGQPEFLIDAASIDGSSGSPVFRYQSQIAATPTGVFEFLMHPRVKFVGVLTRAAELRREAELTNVFSTSESGARATVDLPIHIGYVIKARALQPLIDQVRERTMP